jgi:hypothetical protein
MGKVYFRATILFFLVSSPGWAEVNIPVDCRVKNLPPGRCGWCALETLARFHHIDKLYGLVKAHSTRSTPANLEETLERAGVHYRIQYPGSRDGAILRAAVKNGLGAAVGVYGDYNGHGPHILTLIDYGPDGVRVIDSNDRTLGTRDMSLDDFHYWWDGFAIVLEPAVEPLAKGKNSSSERRYAATDK